MTKKGEHLKLSEAAYAAIGYIGWLEQGLLVATSQIQGCNTKCGNRCWDNPDCECAKKAREFLPRQYR